LRPDKLTVATEDYALSRRLYLYSKGVSDNRFARDFLDFVAHEGQAQVAAVGFVSQDVVALTPANVAQLPSAMQSQVQGAYRLSVNFRFNAGSARLDNKAQRDIDRVLEFVSSNEDAEILLFGFASESDNPGRAELLSKHRAMAVSRALRQAAVYPEAVTGMGAQAPVANIEGNDGRQKNSRVEVWVRAPQSIAGAE
jgi:phosphate transport system substrate-binding protein